MRCAEKSPMICSLIKIKHSCHHSQGTKKVTFQLEGWSKTEDVVQTLLQVRSYSQTTVAPGMGGSFSSTKCVCLIKLSGKIVVDSGIDEIGCFTALVCVGVALLILTLVCFCSSTGRPVWKSLETRLQWWVSQYYKLQHTAWKMMKWWKSKAWMLSHSACCTLFQLIFKLQYSSHVFLDCSQFTITTGEVIFWQKLVCWLWFTFHCLLHSIF